ncbi:hypothetical protein DQ04_00131040 [Trypanosoma grayi]|uniref:hypothetical protein n=1 Tax=Trypanosoma grayi TaxID=71804 RepID=UPI0004F40ECB|nr:hypothetical protein DQ04_00131040 [Trypanosoma grayi]KEG15245.1 hypothetical protein DQ04_00131040 [Trypanosoma grayi]
MEDFRDRGTPPRERTHRRRSRPEVRSRHRRHRRSHSRHRRSSRKRYRSPSRRSSGRSSSSSSISSSSSADSNSSNHSRSRSRRWHRSGGLRNGGAASALLSSEPFSVHADHGVLQRPTTDWECGVCSNLNSVKREDCFRCGTPFSVGANAIPSEEVKILGIPRATTFDDIQRALNARFEEHGETCRIVACNVDSSKAEDMKGVAYVLFESVAEATKALTFARSMLPIGESMCSMEFSSQRRANRKPSGAVKGSDATDAVKVVEGLPDHLQPGVWKPVESFASDGEEKAYLDMLSKLWDKLSKEQKDYYDEGVRRALVARRRKQQEQQQQQTQEQQQQQQQRGGSAAKEAAPSSVTTTATPSNAVSPRDSIMKRLAEKKQQQAMQSASVAPAAVEHATPAASLKERLAMKKAQLSSLSTVKPPPAAETEGASAVTSSATARAPQKDATPALMHLFHGFPIPSRFPTKTDYLTNSKSPSFRAGVIFRYVPPAMAERIVPPSARPPPA